jgi:hypothetical protein
MTGLSGSNPEELNRAGAAMRGPALDAMDDAIDMEVGRVPVCPSTPPLFPPRLVVPVDVVAEIFLMRPWACFSVRG